MNIIEVFAKEISDSRKDKTVLVKIKTNVGEFSASAPNGKSKGKHEAKSYKKNLKEDIKTLSKFSRYFSEEIIEKFEDLRRIEDIAEGHIGANTLFALESAALKALAKEQKKEIWEIIDSTAKNFPRLVGNCIGGGKHSKLIKNKKPDFQEFLLIPNLNTVNQSFSKNRKIKEELKIILKIKDKNFSEEKNDEDAWMVSLNEKEVLDILKKFGDKTMSIGLDVAASGFFKRKRYSYENPMLKRDTEEQIKYISNLIKNFNLYYIEDPFNEEDFESFSKLLKKFPGSLIVGDDLTVTNYKRLKKAIEMKSINALIVKPNQNGSLIKVKRICELAKENNIKIIFSHRSGETEESILADLAFGFQADFIKCGITGKGREIKIKRLIEIEDSLGNK
jgi:enolase